MNQNVLHGVRVLRSGFLPTVAIALLALLTGLVRTAGLGVFALAVATRLLSDAMEAGGHAIPRPHWNPHRPRPIPAPGVSR